MKKNTEKSMSFAKTIIAIGYSAIVLTYMLRFLHSDPHIPLVTVALLCGQLWGPMRRLPF